MTKVELKTQNNEDYSYEALEVFVDGVSIGTVSTSSDSPEDNTLSRMDVYTLIHDLISKIAPNVEIVNTDEQI